MNLLNLSKITFLPVMAILLPLAGALFMAIAILLTRLSVRRGAYAELPRLLYKVPFLIIIVLQLLLSFKILRDAELSPSPFYMLTSGGWKTATTMDELKSAFVLFKADVFGAVSAFMVSFVSFVIGIIALSDRRNQIAPEKCAFFMLTCAGIYGMFYSGGLALIFCFMLLIAGGVSGLYKEDDTNGRSSGHILYFISRLILLLIFLAGAVMLRLEYGTFNITTLSSLIKSTQTTHAAFILMTAPMLYLFFKSPPYLSDASKLCFFGIVAQAALYVAFRVIFSLYGSLDGLQKVPALLIMLGFSLMTFGVIILSGEKSPQSLMESMTIYMKGLITATIGIAVSGTFGAERAALYGVSALESMIAMWLVFMPITAALSLATVYLRQECNGYELWEEGRLASRAPLSFLTLFIVVISIAGLPPFVGFSSKQLLFRSSNFLSSFVLILFFLYSLVMLMISLRFLAYHTLDRLPRVEDFKAVGESTVAIPLFLLLLHFAFSSAAPGYVFDKMVSPSANAIVNRAAFSPAVGVTGSVSFTRIATGFFTWDVYKWLIVFLIAAAIGSAVMLLCVSHFGVVQVSSRRERDDSFAAVGALGYEGEGAARRRVRVILSAFGYERFLSAFGEAYLQPWRDASGKGICALAAIVILFAAAIFMR